MIEKYQSLPLTPQTFAERGDLRNEILLVDQKLNMLKTQRRQLFMTPTGGQIAGEIPTNERGFTRMPVIEGEVIEKGTAEAPDKPQQIMDQPKLLPPPTEGEQGLPFGSGERLSGLPRDFFTKLRADLNLPIDADIDDEYLKAAKAGDTATAQKMVDAAAREQYPTDVFHGTLSDKPFNKFRAPLKGIWTAFNEENAQPGSGDERAGLMRLKADRGERPVILRPEDLQEWRMSSNPLKWMRDFRNYLYLRRGYETANNYPPTSVQVGDYALVVFKPEQLKSADPITYDDAGNVIPLSERFKQDNPDIRYSGLPPEFLKKFANMILRQEGSAGIDPLQAVTRSLTSKIATDGPSGGYLKAGYDGQLEPGRDQMMKLVSDNYAPAKEVITSDWGKKWINDSRTAGTFDYSKLTPAQAVAARKYEKASKSFADFMNRLGIYVQERDPTTGAVTFRPHKQTDGYFPFMVDDSVYEAAARPDSSNWPQLRDDFRKNWAKKFGAGSEKMADEAIRHMLGGNVGNEKGQGGEPLFGPVALPQGVTLPESWRSKNLEKSLQRYIRRSAQHISWAMHVQNDPVMRRIFGLTQDSRGNDTAKTDPTTWDQVPAAWEAAVKEGRRANAKWALEADPAKPPHSEIFPYQSNKLITPLIAGYKQGASLGGERHQELQAASSLAGSVMLQLPSGIRDVGTSAAMSTAYFGPVETGAGIARVLTDFKNKLDQAQRAGAVPPDLLIADIGETSKPLADRLRKWSQLIRHYSGRELLDQVGRVLLYDVPREMILNGRGDHLVKQFGPADTKGMTIQQIADATAARMSRRLSNVTGPASLPAGMLPSSGSASSYMFSLSRWGIGQYNTIKEDIITPMLRDGSKESMGRFLKLMIGSTVIGSVINGLLDWLYDRKPDNLTWGEWLNVAKSEDVPVSKKASELAYSTIAQLQLMGAGGVLTDMAEPFVGLAAGGDPQVNIGQIQYPAVIVGKELWDNTMSFGSAYVNGRADWKDLFEYLGNIANQAQNIKLLTKTARKVTGTADDKRPARDRNVVERVTGIDATSGKPIPPDAGRGFPFSTDPFSFNRQALQRPEDLSAYRGYLGERLRSDALRPISKWSLGPSYYKGLGTIIGEEEAAKQREEHRQMDRKIGKVNREIRRQAGEGLREIRGR